MKRLLSYCFIVFFICGCTIINEKNFTNPIDFGTAFFSSLQSPNRDEVELFFMTKQEINFLYDTLETLQGSTLDTLRDLKEEREDYLSRRDTVFSIWLNNYEQTQNSHEFRFKESTLDNIVYDYVIAKPGKDITIPWPNSKEHTPDLYGAHYAQTMIYFHNESSHYVLTILPFYNGNYWKFDCVSDFEPMIKEIK